MVFTTYNTVFTIATTETYLAMLAERSPHLYDLATEIQYLNSRQYTLQRLVRELITEQEVLERRMNEVCGKMMLTENLDEVIPEGVYHTTIPLSHILIMNSI